MKKKIILTLLAVLMAVACFAISAFASEKADVGTLNIVSKNLSFRDNVYIKFAVETNDPANTELLVWYGKKAETEIAKGLEIGFMDDAPSERLSTVGYTKEIAGGTYWVYNFTSFYARHMTETVYVRAYCNGKYGEIVKYSIHQYVHNVLPTLDAEDPLAVLLQSMLDYGAAAQKKFWEDSSHRLANDTFYQVTAEGGALPDGFESGLYLEGESVTLTAPAVNGEAVPFAYWANERGACISTDRNYTITVGNEDITYYATYRDPSDQLRFILNADGQSYTVTGNDVVFFTDIVIPSTYNGLPVTAIGYEAFKNKHGFRRLSFAENSQVTTIGIAAFYDCNDLESISLPGSITTFGLGSFRDCDSLTDIHLSEGITSLGATMFYQCSAITEITLPRSLTHIGSEALSYCDKLTSITVSENLEEIGGYAFNGSKALTDIYYGGKKSEWDAIPKGDKWDSFTGSYTVHCLGYTKGLAYTKDGEAYIVAGIGSATDTDIIIPATHEGLPVTGIRANAFQNCTSLTAVTLPESITSIGRSAFEGCTNLTSITIPEQVTAIGETVFYNCTSLSGVRIPSAVERIESGAFRNCTSLASVTFAEGSRLTSIGGIAFAYCKALTSITLPSNLTSIGSNAFIGCQKLATVYNNSLLYITAGSSENGDVAYYAKNVYGNKELKQINGYSYYEQNGDYYLVSYTGNATVLTLPSQLEGHTYKIRESAFKGRTELTSITIPQGVTKIGSYAFSGCTALASVTLPSNGLTTIGDRAFQDCSSLRKITIPEGITGINWNTFSGCTSLASVTIPESVRSIYDFAFSGCTSLASITIPEGVTYIGSRAFGNCTNLTSLHISSTVTEIGETFVYGCPNLTTVTVAEGNARYIASEFYLYDSDAESLILAWNQNGAYNITGNFKKVGNYAFAGCTGLTGIHLPESVEVIGEYAFENCTNLEYVTLDGPVKEIGAKAFLNCSKLTEINYGGTAAQWYAINFGAGWSIGTTGTISVNCNKEDANA